MGDSSKQGTGGGGQGASPAPSATPAPAEGQPVAPGEGPLAIPPVNPRLSGWEFKGAEGGEKPGSQKIQKATKAPSESRDRK